MRLTKLDMLATAMRESEPAQVRQGADGADKLGPEGVFDSEDPAGVY